MDDGLIDSRDLPDLADMPLADLAAVDNPAVRAALARIRDQAATGSAVAAGFNSAL
jgi:FXSXX-COOH protein